MYIFGKVYNVITGGGSWGNVVVDIMVDKLILKTIDHLYPYNLSWL